MATEPQKAHDRSFEQATPESADPGSRNETVPDLKNRLRAQEQRYAELFEQLSYALLHDMSELLRMVRSYVALQRRRKDISAEDTEFTGYILDGTQRMDQLLSEFSVYAHQFRPPEKLSEPANSEAVLAGVLLNLDGAISKTGATVTNDPLPQIWCDPTQLGHVFRHLIQNSVTFRREERPLVHITAAQDGDSAAFSVRDNGLGIDSRFHDQIFTIFKRLHGRDYPGNGLGLAICKRIVEQHGGRIWLESTPGQGSTFHFTMPAAYA